MRHYREQGIEEYFLEVNKFPLLDKEQENEVCDKLKEGDEDAQNYLIGCNLRLVVSIAKTYVRRGLPLLDLIEEGNVGLTKAANHFRSEEGCRFSTYATWLIHQGIKKALVDNAKLIRIPSYLAPKIGEWKRVEERMYDELGRKPSIYELARELKISDDKLDIFQKAMLVSKSVSQTASLDTSANEDSMLSESLTAPGESALQGMIEKSEKKEVLDLVDLLPKRDQIVIELRYGLNGKEPQTLQQIGDRIRLSRERVRQIELAALQKLGEYFNDPSTRPRKLVDEYVSELEERIETPQKPTQPKEEKKKKKTTKSKVTYSKPVREQGDKYQHNLKEAFKKKKGRKPRGDDTVSFPLIIESAGIDKKTLFSYRKKDKTLEQLVPLGEQIPLSKTKQIFRTIAQIQSEED